MEILDIKGLTPSLIKVYIGDKIILISGELTIDKFYADANSLIKWEPPYENEIISAIEKKKIIAEIENKTRGAITPIIFD